MQVGYEWHNKNANLGYAQSISAFNYLLDEFGTEAFIQFMEYMKSVEFDEAFESAYDFPVSLFNITWLKWAKKTYRPYALIDIHSLLWVFTPFLLIIAFIRTKFKNYKLTREWEFAESLDAPEPTEEEFEFTDEEIKNNKSKYTL